MINDIVWSETQTIDGTSRMQDTWDARAKIDVFTYALHACRIMEVGRANSFADYVPIHTTTLLLHAHTLHDIDKLRSDLSHFFQGLCMDEVFLSPLRVVLVHLPLFVDVQQSQMITLWHLEVFSSCIAFLLTVLWSEEDRWHRQH